MSSSENIKRFECKECTKVFLKKSNLNAHMLAKHSNVEKYLCSVCEKSFSYKQSFNRHMNVHRVAISVYSCSECGYSSQLKFMLTRHIKTVHLNRNDSALHVPCVFCNQQCTKSNLSTHYVLFHKNEIVSEKLKFNNLDAFYAWKYEVEDQDVSRYAILILFIKFQLFYSAIYIFSNMIILDLSKLDQHMLVCLVLNVYFLNVIVMESISPKVKILES